MLLCVGKRCSSGRDGVQRQERGGLMEQVLEGDRKLRKRGPIFFI